MIPGRRGKAEAASMAKRELGSLIAMNFPWTTFPRFLTRIGGLARSPSRTSEHAPVRMFGRGIHVR